MKQKFTHTGYIVGCNACVSKEYVRPVKLRLTPTKKWWVDEFGIKYYGPESAHFEGLSLDTWSNYKLDRKSVNPIEGDA